MKPICDHLHPHQVLAAQVIRQALTDLNDHSPLICSDACQFLQGSPALAWWCAVAGLDYAVVVMNAQPLLRKANRVGTRRAA